MFSHDEERVRAERARAVGLFRYSLIREAADPGLTTKQRGRVVRGLADGEHQGPFGLPVRVSRATAAVGQTISRMATSRATRRARADVVRFIV